MRVQPGERERREDHGRQCGAGARGAGERGCAAGTARFGSGTSALVDCELLAAAPGPPCREQAVGEQEESTGPASDHDEPGRRGDHEAEARDAGDDEHRIGQRADRDDGQHVLASDALTEDIDVLGADGRVHVARGEAPRVEALRVDVDHDRALSPAVRPRDLGAFDGREVGADAEQMAALRNELTVLRESLQRLFDGDLPTERTALRADAVRVQELPSSDSESRAGAANGNWQDTGTWDAWSQPEEAIEQDPRSRITPVFEATQIFNSEASGNNATGIQPGETLGLVFDIKPGKTPSDVFVDLSTGALRIGLHVTSIDPSDDSDGFVNRPPQGSQIPGVPEPASLAIWSLGLALAGVGARRMRKKVG